MYPITCAGGYPIPIKIGKMSIVGIVATVNDPTAASRITLVDSAAGKELADDSDLKPAIVDLKGLANANGTIGVMFAEPIKLRDGVTIGRNTTNLIAGRTFVYIR
jgi:hypothetical protein